MIRMAVYAGTALLLTFGIWWAWHSYTKRIHDEGFAECRQQVDQAVADANARADAAEQELRKVRESAALEVAQIRAARSTGRASAQRIVNANPSFAAVARPAELHDQRLRELEAVRRSAIGN